YRDALQIDPRSAAAAAGIAYLKIFEMQGGAAPDRVLPELDQWSAHAIDFDPNYALGWASRAVAEFWRVSPDPVRQLDFGVRAAAAGEACGACQLALMEGVTPLSKVLMHHIALQDAELDPLSAYGLINSAVALTALGRDDEASTAVARAAAIEP